MAARPTLNEMVHIGNLLGDALETLEALFDKQARRYPCGGCQLIPGKCGSTRRLCVAADRADAMIASGEVP